MCEVVDPSLLEGRRGAIRGIDLVTKPYRIGSRIESIVVHQMALPE